MYELVGLERERFLYKSDVQQTQYLSYPRAISGNLGTGSYACLPLRHDVTKHACLYLGLCTFSGIGKMCAALASQLQYASHDLAEQFVVTRRVHKT